jgi:hypothetical protein
MTSAIWIRVKGTVQKTLRGVETRLIRSVLSRPFLFLNFKVTPSQEEYETIFSGLKINVMALSDQIDFLAFLRLC